MIGWLGNTCRLGEGLGPFDDEVFVGEVTEEY